MISNYLNPCFEQLLKHSIKSFNYKELINVIKLGKQSIYANSNVIPN